MDNPDGIANMFMQYLVSVFSLNKTNKESVIESNGAIMTFSEVEVSCVLRSLDSSKTAGPSGSPAGRNQKKEGASVV